MVVCCFNGHPCCNKHTSTLSSGPGLSPYNTYVCKEHYHQVVDDAFRVKEKFKYFFPYDIG
jgi:hypothetical protein